MQLRGKVAVITGGASGIGRGTAWAFVRRGMAVVLADVNEHRLAQTEAELAARGGRCLAVRCDVARDDDVERLAQRALAEMGRVDLLMNNAGVVLRGALEELTLADWRWQMEINLFGVIRGVRAFLPHMLERGSGYVVNTGSMAGLLALTGEGAPYIASKFAVVGLSEALALYARPRGIGVSLVCPASVDTNLAETGRSVGMTPERQVAETAIAAAVQGDRLMQPDEVGEAVARGVEADQFLILPDPAQQPLLERRARDMNAYLEERLRRAGMSPSSWPPP
jgi:NAD(P)-dependent dehydrogenase (short-subunit alcohol dehydrogenase family)